MNLFLTFLEAGMSKIKMPESWLSGEGCSLLQDTALKLNSQKGPVSSHGRRQKGKKG
jgi:hypothetical protein